MSVPYSVDTHPVRIRPGLIHLAVLLAYSGLTVMMTWPLVLHAAQAIPGDGFDGWQNYWNLWWLKTALIERATNPFWTDILYAPTGVGLYFHTLNPLNGLLSMPVQLAAGLIPAYNTVVLVSWVLSGYGAFLLCVWLLRSAAGTNARYAAGFLAGVIYAFAPFHMAHLLGHMQVMSLQWIPFYILFLLRSVECGRSARTWLPDALLAGLFLVFNGLSDWYFVLYLFLFTGVALVYSLWVDWAERRRAGALTVFAVLRSLGRVAAPAVVAGVVFLVVLSPVLLPMVSEATQHSFMVRPATDLYILSASLADYAIPSRMHTLLREIGPALPGNQIAPVSERTLAVGYVAAILALAGVALQRRRAAFWLLAALFFLLVSLGPRLHLGNITWDSIPADGGGAALWTPFGILNRTVPFMRISRSVSRYALMVQLSISVLAAFGLYALLRRFGHTAGVVLAAFVVVSVIAEYWVAPYPFSPPDTPDYYASLAGETGDGAVLNLPMNYDRPGYLLYQTVHGRPLTVAYISRDDPRTLTERVPVLQHFRHLAPDIVADDPAQVGMTVLNDLGVEYVTLDRYKMPGGKERDYTEALASAIFAGQEPVYENERLTVYRVHPVETPTPYVELGTLDWQPLRSNAQNGAAGRAVGDGPACFTVRHASHSTTATVQYNSDRDAHAILLDAEGVTVSALPPAPDSGRITVEAGAASGEDAVFCIQADAPASVRVTRIELGSAE